MNIPKLPPALLRAYGLTLDALRDALLLGIRAYIVWVFFRAGLTKIDDWSSTTALFQYEYSVPLLPPAIAAILGTAGELLLPPLLLLGLGTRFAALGLFIVNAMAVISYPALWDFECPAAIQSHFFWGTLLLVLLTMGSGRLAADHWLGRICRHKTASLRR